MKTLEKFWRIFFKNIAVLALVISAAALLFNAYIYQEERKNRWWHWVGSPGVGYADKKNALENLHEANQDLGGIYLAPQDISDNKDCYRRIILKKINLPGANLKDAIFVCAELEEANLTDANLRRANLTDAKLWRANLTDAMLWSANLTDALLGQANLTNAYLVNTNLTGANLDSADLTGANLDSADLTGANLINANLTRATLHSANLTNAYLVNANLTGANFGEANLTGANFRESNLTGANLANANLTSTHISSADFTKVKNLESEQLEGTWYFNDSTPTLTNNLKGIKIKSCPASMREQWEEETWERQQRFRQSNYQDPIPIYGPPTGCP